MTLPGTRVAFNVLQWVSARADYRANTHCRNRATPAVGHLEEAIRRSSTSMIPASRSRRPCLTSFCTPPPTDLEMSDDFARALSQFMQHLRKAARLGLPFIHDDKKVDPVVSP